MRSEAWSSPRHRTRFFDECRPMSKSRGLKMFDKIHSAAEDSVTRSLFFDNFKRKRPWNRKGNSCLPSWPTPSSATASTPARVTALGCGFFKKLKSGCSTTTSVDRFPLLTFARRYNWSRAISGGVFPRGNGIASQRLGRRRSSRGLCRSGMCDGN